MTKTSTVESPRRPRRNGLQVDIDVLRSINRVRKAREPISNYAIERRAGVSAGRLKKSLKDLRSRGLIEDGMEITTKGYAFLEEMTGSVLRSLNGYGYWSDFH